MSSCRPRIAVMFAILAHCGYAVYLSFSTIPSNDELPLLPSGLAALKLGVVDDLRIDGPPPRILAALPALFFEPKCDWTQKNLYGRNVAWGTARAFVEANGRRARFLYSVSRLPFLGVSIGIAFLCWRWAGEEGGEAAAAFAALLWLLSPDAITLAASASSDLLAAGAALACLYLARQKDALSIPRIAASGFFLGLCVASKSAAVLLVPILALSYVIQAARARSGGVALLRVLLSITIVAYVTLTLIYIPFSATTVDHDELHSRSVRWLMHVVPLEWVLPSDFIRMCDSDVHLLTARKFCCLYGMPVERRVHGVLILRLCTRMPIAFLAGCVIIAIVGFRRIRELLTNSGNVLWAVPVAVAAIISILGAGNLSYATVIITAYPFVCVACGCTAYLKAHSEYRYRMLILCSSMVLAACVELAATFPFAASFMNIAATPARGTMPVVNPTVVSAGRNLPIVARIIARDYPRNTHYFAWPGKIAGHHFGIPVKYPEWFLYNDAGSVPAGVYVFGMDNVCSDREKFQHFLRRGPDRIIGNCACVYVAR